MHLTGPDAQRLQQVTTIGYPDTLTLSQYTDIILIN